MNFTPEPPTNSTTHYFGPADTFNVCTFSIGFIFGFPTHLYVLLLIVTGSGVASEFFNLNLSVCETLICLNLSIFALSYRFFSLSTVKTFFVGFSVTGRPLFQCLICVERYLAVVHPLTFLKYKPLRCRVICCTAVWIITLCSCLCCMNFMNDEKLGVNVYTWFFSTQFLLYLSIQLFCLVAVLRALKQSGPGERRKEEENHMKRRAFYLILIATASMSFTYGPYAIIGFFSLVIKEVIEELWTIGFICYMLAGFVHPVVYLHCAGKLSCPCLPQFLIKTKG